MKLKNSVILRVLRVSAFRNASRQLPGSVFIRFHLRTPRAPRIPIPT